MLYLIFASGENFDIVFAAGWTGYKAQAEKGGYLELTDENLLVDMVAEPEFVEELLDAITEYNLK